MVRRIQKVVHKKVCLITVTLQHYHYGSKIGDFIVWLNGKDVVGMNHKEMGQQLKVNKVSQIKVLRVLEKDRPVPAQKSEETDSSFKTIEVQYTGDEELSSAVAISPNKETVAMNKSENPQRKTEVTDKGQISKKTSTTTLDRDSSLSCDNGPALPMSPTVRRHESIANMLCIINIYVDNLIGCKRGEIEKA